MYERQREREGGGGRERDTERCTEVISLCLCSVQGGVCQGMGLPLIVTSDLEDLTGSNCEIRHCRASISCRGNNKNQRRRFAALFRWNPGLFYFFCVGVLKKREREGGRERERERSKLRSLCGYSYKTRKLNEAGRQESERQSSWQLAMDGQLYSGPLQALKEETRRGEKKRSFDSTVFSPEGTLTLSAPAVLECGSSCRELFLLLWQQT